MGRVLRIGILGAAKIAPSALIEPARERSDMIVTHVAARDPVREAEFANAHGLEAAGGYEALIARDDLDLIYIAVPPSGHCEWTIRALEAGKAVLCEKPFSMTTAEAEKMIAASVRTGLPLIEAFHYRFHPTLVHAQQLMREQRLGPLVRAGANFCIVIHEVAGEFRWNAALGGGALMDLGCYPFHALRTLIGSEPELLGASASYRSDVEAEAEARLSFAGQVPALIRCSMSSSERRLDLEIVGEKGRLTISNFIVPHFGGSLTLETDTGTITEEAEPVSTYSAQLAHVSDVMLHGAEPLTGGQDAIANMRLIEAVRNAARAGLGQAAASPIASTPTG